MKRLANKLTVTQPGHLTVQLGWLAALLYSSWPLAYLLNPLTLQHGLASDLEKSGQPFSWVFITCDLISGSLLIIVGLLQWQRTSSKLIRIAIIGYTVFGATVASAAIMPLHCDYISGQCIEWLFSPTVVFHAGLSIISVSFLTLAVWVALVLARFKRASKLLFESILAVAIAMPLLGVGGLVEILSKSNDNRLTSYFISICSLAIGLTIRIIDYASKAPNLSLKLYWKRRILRLKEA